MRQTQPQRHVSRSVWVIQNPKLFSLSHPNKKHKKKHHATRKRRLFPIFQLPTLTIGYAMRVFLGREKHPSREVAKVSRYLKKNSGPFEASENGIPSKKRTVYILLMVQKSQTTTWDVEKKQPANEGILSPSQLVIAEFLNHQQYPLEV